jgi:hypothetical protein
LWRKYVLIQPLTGRERSEIVFHKSSAATVETMTIDQPKESLWGFRRRAPRGQAVAPVRAEAEDAAFVPDAAPYSVETFGRGGLQLGGLHRDQQWVGAWGGRC